MNKITIVDDDTDLRNLLEVVLRFNNFAVQIFSSAEDFYRGYDAGSNLFIIDINLGGISGLELCESLKKEERTKNIPVIIISAHPELEALAKKACADAVLPKPFSKQALMEKISSVLT